MSGEMIEQFHVMSMFNSQRQRREVWMKKYPNHPDAISRPALTELENVRPETMAIYTSTVDPTKLAFGPFESPMQPLPLVESDL